MRAAYRSLAKRHHPDLNAGSADALARSRELNAAHEVLSDPARRRAYDRERFESEAPAPARSSGRIARNISQDVRLRIEDFIRGTAVDVRVDDPANPNGAENYELIIPPGTAPNARFRLPRTAPFADGFVQIRLRALPGSRFKVRGHDLRCDLRIDARRAKAGGTETIAGVSGSMLRIPIRAGVGRGEIVRIAGQGMPKPRGGRGDLLVRLTYRPDVTVSRRPTR